MDGPDGLLPLYLKLEDVMSLVLQCSAFALRAAQASLRTYLVA